MTDDTPHGADDTKDASDEHEAGVGDSHLDELLSEGGSTADSEPDSTPPVDPAAAQITALESERDALKEQLLRALAEAENVRKRANRQIAEERVYAVERFARDLLNVSDNLSRALLAIPQEARDAMSETSRTLVDGVELTEKELHAVMARHGVTAIDAGPGATFDPNFHQAVSQIPSEHPAGSVAQSFQSGWKIGDRTLRAAMVAVSGGGADHSGAAKESPSADDA